MRGSLLFAPGLALIHGVAGALAKAQALAQAGIFSVARICIGFKLSAVFPFNGCCSPFAPCTSQALDL